MVPRQAQGYRSGLSGSLGLRQIRQASSSSSTILPPPTLDNEEAVEKLDGPKAGIKSMPCCLCSSSTADGEAAASSMAAGDDGQWLGFRILVDFRQWFGFIFFVLRMTLVLCEEREGTGTAYRYGNEARHLFSHHATSQNYRNWSESEFNIFYFPK